MSLIDVTTHYELLHAVFRKENDPIERERVKGVMEFLTLKFPVMRKFLDTEEFWLMVLISDHYNDLREGVSRHELGEIVHRQDKSDGMTAILKAYDDWVPTFKGSYDAVSTMSLMNRCLADYQSYMFVNFLSEARGIAAGGITNVEKGKKGEPDKIGLRDARTFLMEKLQSPLFSHGRMNQGGFLDTIAEDLGNV
jgi:hypothetical protein